MLKDYSAEGCFNLIAATITNIFNTPSQPNLKISIYEKLDFLESKVVSLFCDCSDNFDQAKLIKEFKKQSDFINLLYNFMEKKDINRESIIRILLLNRILLSEKSPARKTHIQIAKKLNCDLRLVGRAESFILDSLKGKIAVLEILIDIKK